MLDIDGVVALLVRTDPRLGLIDTEVDALIAFAAGLDTVEDDDLP